MIDIDVVGLGALNYDILYSVEKIAMAGEEIGVIDVYESPGGSASNTIVALSRLGLTTGFIGIVGKDAHGDAILEDFKREGVDISNVKLVNGTTGTAMGFVDPTGERCLYVHPGVNDLIVDFGVEHIQRTKILHVTSFVNRKQLEMQSNLIKEISDDIKVSFNPGMLCFKFESRDLKKVISNSHVVFLSEKEMGALLDVNYEEGAEFLLSMGVQIVAITLGDRGCYVRRGNESRRIPAYPTEVVDTTGAGDAFAAGFLYGLLRSKNMYECGKLGNAVASSCISDFGTRKGLPTESELNRLYPL